MLHLWTAKQKQQENSANNRNTKDTEITVPLKYFSNFWRTLEMSLINSDIYFVLTWKTLFSSGNHINTR